MVRRSASEAPRLGSAAAIDMSGRRDRVRLIPEQWVFEVNT